MKANGFSDRQLAKMIECTANEVRERRVECNVMPLIKQIDTVAG